MTCASCVRKVETALTRVDDVQDATVNLADRTARILTAGKADLGTLVAAIERAGYGARPHTDEADPDEEFRGFRRRFVGAAVLTVPGLVLTFLLPDVAGATTIAGGLTAPGPFLAGMAVFRAAFPAARHP